MPPHEKNRLGKDNHGIDMTPPFASATEVFLAHTGALQVRLLLLLLLKYRRPHKKSFSIIGSPLEVSTD